MALTKDTVKAIFANLAGDSARFFDHVADDVHWTVMGTHPLAGVYTSKKAFTDATFSRLGPHFEGGMKLHTRDIFLDGDTAIVELMARITSKKGTPFNNDYCWVCRFAGEKIVEVRAYLDSALVAKLIGE